MPEKFIKPENPHPLKTGLFYVNVDIFIKIIYVYYNLYTQRNSVIVIVVILRRFI